jgi:hypothetical protein
MNPVMQRCRPKAELIVSQEPATVDTDTAVVTAFDGARPPLFRDLNYSESTHPNY